MTNLHGPSDMSDGHLLHHAGDHLVIGLLGQGLYHVGSKPRLNTNTLKGKTQRLGGNAGRCSDRSMCAEGDSAREPWVVTHNVLLAHAAAVERFRALVPQGNISINLNAEWSEPMTSSVADKVPLLSCIFLDVQAAASLFKASFP